MRNNYWIQLFADGDAGDGGAGAGTGAETAAAPAAEAGAETGATPSVAAEDRAKELGIPANYRTAFAKSQKAPIIGAVQAGAQPEPTQDGQEAKVTPEDNQPRRSLKDMIKEDADLNREVQSLIQDALRGRGKEMQSRLDAANEAIAAIAPKYNLDASDMTNFDYKAFMEKAAEDKSIWEEKANELGVSIEQAQNLEYADQQRRREAADRKKAEARAQFQQHFDQLRAQGNELEREFRDFRFDDAMKDERFVNLTRPGGISVREAYLAMHGDELIANASKSVAAGIQKKMSNAIAAGAARPQENGSQSQGQTVQRFDYSHMSKQEKEQFLREARAAWNRGEKVYMR